MTFQCACFLENLLGLPIQFSEMHGQGNCSKPAGSRGAAAHSQRDLIVHPDRDRRRRLCV